MNKAEHNDVKGGKSSRGFFLCRKLFNLEFGLAAEQLCAIQP